MESLLEFARGPAFRFALLFMLLGLARHLVLTLWGVRRAIQRAGDQKIPYRRIFKETLAWMVPIGKLRGRLGQGLMSVVFHVGVIVVPLFLAGHIALWRQGLGFGWPALGGEIADVLTLVTIATAVGLSVWRFSTREGRGLSEPSDHALLYLLALPFATGFLAMHPTLNPFDATGTLAVHVLSGDLAMILLPVTKLAHCVLFPTTQLVSEVAWHFPPTAGDEVGAALAPKQEPTC